MCSLKRWKTSFRAFTKQGRTPLKPATTRGLNQRLNMHVVSSSCMRRLPLSRKNGKTLRERSADMQRKSSNLSRQPLSSDTHACRPFLQNHVQLCTMKYPNLLGDSLLEEFAKDFAHLNLPFSDRFYKRSVIWEGLRNEAMFSTCWNTP